MHQAVRPPLRRHDYTCWLARAIWATTRFRIAFIVPLLGANAVAFESIETSGWTLTPALEARLGLQYGNGINFGLGAIDAPAEEQRASLSVSLEPRLAAARSAFDGTFYSAVSLVGASNLLDGELSGQFARAGDSRVDIDEAHVGWRNAMFDLSLGPQLLTIGDGLVIADGNFDVGDGQGQFWVAPFNAWKNAAVLKVNGDNLRADMFWLRSDGGFGDSRLYGLNIETADVPYGRFGMMYLDIYRGDALAYDGVEAWNLRALDVPVPLLRNLKIYAEVVLQLGQDDDGGGVENAGLGWYIETAWTVPKLAWATILTYRYAHFSGDELDSAKNETYRSLFYGFYAREWDTFYQGEIAGEYHLFNSNQNTQFIKLRTFPTAAFALTLYYFQHDLEEANYFGTAVSSKDWADEINFGVEYFKGHEIYLYAGLAWSRPNAAAAEVFGDDDFAVLQTWMSFLF